MNIEAVPIRLALATAALLSACAAKNADTSSPGDPSAQPTTDVGRANASFEDMSKQAIKTYLEREGFVQTGQGQFLGSDLIVYNRDGSDGLTAAEATTLLERSLEGMRDFAFSFNVSGIPKDESNVLSGKIFDIAVTDEPGTCLVTTDEVQTEIGSFGRELTQTDEYDACGVNAFSIVPVASWPAEIAGTMSNRHLIVSTGLPDHIHCPEGQTQLTPQGTTDTFCVDHGTAARSGVVHEAVHQFLRTFFGLTEQGPFTGDSYKEEHYAGTIEADVLKEHFGVSPHP